jgi:SAM-dependent methyltransferase
MGPVSSGFQLSGSAPDNYDRYLSTIMAPFVGALLEEVEVRPGDAVLDVACGTGFAARAAALRMGGHGRVCGIDVNPGMLDTAARVSTELSPLIQWHEAAADSLPFESASFDAVVCQQGLQFFPDMEAAVEEMARVTKPGGRIAVTVWSRMEQSPYFEAQFGAARALLGDVATEGFLSAFGLGQEMLVETLIGSGLMEAAAQELSTPVRLPDVEDFIPGHLMSIPWGLAVAEAASDGLDVASTMILDAISRHIDPDGSATIPFASYLASARKPPT